MNIKTVVVGSLDTNCYILELNDEILIIDPGAEADKIISNIPSDKKVVGVIITHSHFDHIGALDEILEFYKVKSYNKNNLIEGQNKIGKFTFDIIYTLGHLDDSISIYFTDEKIMFVGDFIFKGSIGRWDLGGNQVDMKNSIKLILKYDKDIKLYPGHFATTTLGLEEENLKYYLNIL